MNINLLGQIFGSSIEMLPDSKLEEAINSANNNTPLGDFTTQPRPEPLWVNPWTSKAQRIRITPHHTPFPEKKNPRRNRPRAVKKDSTFNYKEGC